MSRAAILASNVRFGVEVEDLDVFLAFICRLVLNHHHLHGMRAQNIVLIVLIERYSLLYQNLRVAGRILVDGALRLCLVQHIDREFARWLALRFGLLRVRAVQPQIALTLIID